MVGVEVDLEHAVTPRKWRPDRARFGDGSVEGSRDASAIEHAFISYPLSVLVITDRNLLVPAMANDGSFLFDTMPG